MFTVLKPGAIRVDQPATSKKQVLQVAAEMAELHLSLDRAEVLEGLLSRERLGSTACGHGVAIPHTRLPTVSRPHGLFLRLQRPVDFDAVDATPVDLVFVLLAPQTDDAAHLTALARVARFLKDRLFCEKLRGADGVDAVQALFATDTGTRAPCRAA